MIPLAIKYEPAATSDEPRSGRVVGWLRELFLPEPADARRQRIEAEAAAVLGLTTTQQSDHPAGL